MDPKDVFSVKSAYNLVINLDSASKASSFNFLKHKSKSRVVLNLNIVPRVKN